MWETLKALATSRKAWVGTMTVMAIACSTVLVAMGKVEASQLTAMIAGITATGMTVIGAIAWEDTAKSDVKARIARFSKKDDLS
jgi:hypothetical protein